MPRDTVRDYWRGESHGVAELASRLSGSSDLYAHNGRRPYASINFVTAHDGFTMRDLVSYNAKHNEANLDGNSSGEDHNRSWNMGAEGPSDDPTISALRLRQQRNFLATLLLSQGVPMLLGGDEFARTQCGNNNAYCQDNELSWYDWGFVESSSEVEGNAAGVSREEQRALLAFTKRLIALRRAHPVLRRRDFFHGEDRGSVSDLVWLRPDGEEMEEPDWADPERLALMVFLNGRAIPSVEKRGRPIVDDTFLMACNASHRTVRFRLPGQRYARSWQLDVDTREPVVPRGRQRFRARATLEVDSPTFLLLRRRDDARDR